MASTHRVSAALGELQGTAADGAAALLWERYERFLIFLAHAFLKTQSGHRRLDPEAVAHDAFVSVLTYLKSQRAHLADVSKDQMPLNRRLFKALLRKALQWAAANHCRAVAKFAPEEGESAIDGACGSTEAGGNPTTLGELAEDRRQQADQAFHFLWDDMIALLPDEDDRSLVWMLYVEGLTQDEVVERTKIPKRSLQRRVQEVKDKLADAMADWYPQLLIRADSSESE